MSAHLRSTWAALVTQKVAMPVSDFKGRDRNLTKAQVLAACKRILKDMARQLGYKGELPEIQLTDVLPGLTQGRVVDKVKNPTYGAPWGGAIILLNETFWLPEARDREYGYDSFAVLAHEAIHALIQKGEPSYPGFSQMFTEGGAEILRIAYWAQHMPPYDDRDATRRDGKWTAPGAVSLVARMNYKEWVAEFMLRLASKVGWNRDAILAECRRVVSGNGNVKLDFWRSTKANFSPPPGLKKDAESLMLWMIEGYVRAR